MREMQNKNSPDVILDQYAQVIAQQSPENPESIPEEFLFDSKVIVLSEETEIPEYLPEDVLAFQINYNKDQAIQLIDQNLQTLGTEFPELTLEDKRDILSFIRKNRHGGTISLKTFLHIALIWKTRDPGKESWMLNQFR